MKNFRTIAAVALAAVTLASCNKEENANNGDTASVKISFTYPESSDTRADQAAATAGTATFKPGHIFFANAAGVIDKHVVVVANSPTAGQVSLSDLTSGEVVIEDVSSSATMCYILSNDAPVFTGANAIAANLVGQNISAVLSKQISVNAMNGTGIDNVPMYGTGTVTSASGTTTVGTVDYTASVNVQINSLASRLQIGKISAANFTNATSGDVVKIKTFTVAGIYINNTFSQMTPASVVAASADIDNGSTITNYSKDPGTDYTTSTGIANMLADEPSAVAADDSGVMTADQSTPANFWAYNVFPQGIPHIVIKLSNITYTITPSGGSESSANTVSGDQWLTIQNYKMSGGGAAVTAFAANNIYTLSDIQFDFSDLSVVPYSTALDVLVTVSMFNWIDTPIEWVP